MVLILSYPNYQTVMYANTILVFEGKEAIFHILNGM